MSTTPKAAATPVSQAAGSRGFRSTRAGLIGIEHDGRHDIAEPGDKRQGSPRPPAGLELRQRDAGERAPAPLAYLRSRTGRSPGAAFCRRYPAVDHARRGGGELGAGRWRTLTRVTLPQLKPGLAAGASLAFVAGLGDIVASIVLYTYETRPVSIEILLEPAACRDGSRGGLRRGAHVGQRGVLAWERDDEAALGADGGCSSTCWFDARRSAHAVLRDPDECARMDGGLADSAFAVAQLISSPIWGKFSDRYGRRPAMLIGLSGSALAYLVFGFATSLWMLFASRLVQGTRRRYDRGGAAYVATRWLRRSARKALGWISAATSAGVLIGPVIGSVARSFGTEVPGMVAAGLMLLCVVFAWRWLPESRVHHTHTPSGQQLPPDRTIKEALWQIVEHPSAPAASRDLDLRRRHACVERRHRCDGLVFQGRVMA